MTYGAHLPLGDELFSDTYPMKVVHDLIYEVQGKVKYTIVLAEML